MRQIQLITIAVALMLYVTNPSEPEYIHWLKGLTASAMRRDEFAGALISIFGSPVFEHLTVQKDFGLFSIFTTDIGKEQIYVLGIFHRFYAGKEMFIPIFTGAAFILFIVMAASRQRTKIRPTSQD